MAQDGPRRWGSVMSAGRSYLHRNSSSTSTTTTSTSLTSNTDPSIYEHRSQSALSSSQGHFQNPPYSPNQHQQYPDQHRQYPQHYQQQQQQQQQYLPQVQRRPVPQPQEASKSIFGKFIRRPKGKPESVPTAPATQANTPVAIGKIRPPDPIREATSERIKRDAQMCVMFLRKMYALDFEIWGSRGVGHADSSDVDDLRIEANKNLLEVKGIVKDWESIPKGNINEDEKVVMIEIRRALGNVPDMRYEIETV